VVEKPLRHPAREDKTIKTTDTYGNTLVVKKVHAAILERQLAGEGGTLNFEVVDPSNPNKGKKGEDLKRLLKKEDSSKLSVDKKISEPTKDKSLGTHISDGIKQLMHLKGNVVNDSIQTLGDPSLLVVSKEPSVVSNEKKKVLEKTPA
jgi:hypothetical protein